MRSALDRLDVPRFIEPTLDLAEAAGRTWDVVAVGAGPAGALAAHELARQGIDVLLVDKSQFPRTKVCGCCLSARALAALANVGLGDLSARCGAKPLHTVRLAARGRQARLPIGGRALSRDVFDAALVQAAIEAGAYFLPEAVARLGPVADDARMVFLRQDGREALVLARIVLGADGLGGRLLAGEADHRSSIAVDSRLGAGAAARQFPSFYEDGSIFMACGTGGYVGLVRLEDERLNVAAAFDVAFVKQAGGTGRAAAAIVEEAGLPAIAGFDALAWHGTPLLTRSVQPPAAERVFLLGDAAGYVEPFTGEGMACALGCGAAVVPQVRRALDRWSSSHIRQWSAAYRQLIGRRQWVCRAAASVLRRPGLVRLIMPALACVPWLATPIVRYLSWTLRGS